MADMVIQTFRLTPPQMEALKDEAKELGINASELLRRILDERRLSKTGEKK